MCCILFSTQMSAQIGVFAENPDQSSALEIRANGNNAGFLLPRMTTAQKLAIENPAHNLLVYDTDNNCISQYIDSVLKPGTYSWTCLTIFNKHFFYMPSVNIPTGDEFGKKLVGEQTFDLYGTYSADFTAPALKNTTAPASIKTFGIERLHFYITYNDPCITVNSLSNQGELKYTVNNLPDYDAYVNVVFVLK